MPQGHSRPMDNCILLQHPCFWHSKTRTLHILTMVCNPWLTFPLKIFPIPLHLARSCGKEFQRLTCPAKKHFISLRNWIHSENSCCVKWQTCSPFTQGLCLYIYNHALYMYCNITITTDALCRPNQAWLSSMQISKKKPHNFPTPPMVSKF